MKAYLAHMERQKHYGGPRKKTLGQKTCLHPRTYLTDTKIRDYPDGEWIALPVHRMCRDCWWPEPVQ